ncbi:MAG: cytochrome c peroxidase [Methylococcales bacterium]
MLNWRLVVLFLTAIGLIDVRADEFESVTQEIQAQISAPGYGHLDFPAPVVGSYQLPVLGLAGNGLAVDVDDKDLNLHDLMGDKLMLLSFVYSTCNDTNGCPLATAVFYRIKQRLASEPELASQLRLVTLSFNPQYDTPAVMREYGKGLTGRGLDWRFLTTRSEQVLQPILDQYQQTVQKVFDAQGKFTGAFSHILRVYLIDKNKRLRNIYSVAFLHPDTLINDVKTVLQEQGQHQTLIASTQSLTKPSTRHLTAKALTVNSKKTVSPELIDLMQSVQNPPLGLPVVPVPENNAVTLAKINLGRKLFFDRRLSLNKTISCAMCHVPNQGFSSNEMKTAVGMEGRTVNRNSPTIYNVAYYTALFHDGRETTLEQQVWSPLLAHNEMANPSIGFVLATIKSSADYNGLFEQAFGKKLGMETVGMALASYQRTLISANSKFDQWQFGNNNQAMNAAEKNGYDIFVGKGGCANCHVINDESALFTDNSFHNTGIGFAEAMQTTPEKHRVQLAPGVFTEVDADIVDSVSESTANDLGRYAITLDPHDRWKYKTPSLRNIALTAPYMHNGAFETLQQVVTFYNKGGVRNPEIDSAIKPLKLDVAEQADLVAFLRALTGDNVDEIIADALAESIGDPD